MQKMSLTHCDFRARNVLIDDHGNSFVIDWGAAEISDYRIDLGGLIFTGSVFVSQNTGKFILDYYEKSVGHKVNNIEYFEMFAAARWLSTYYLAVVDKLEEKGMLPEILGIAKEFTKIKPSVDRLVYQISEIDINES